MFKKTPLRRVKPEVSRVCGRYVITPRRGAPGAMALLKLSGDEQRIVFGQLCNVLEQHLQ